MILPAARVRFVAIEEDGRLIGGMPVIAERRGGLHRLYAMPVGLPGAPLARRGAHAAVDRAAAHALAALERGLNAAGGLWTLYRPCGPEVETESLAALSGETRWLDTWLIDLDRGLSAARARLEGSLRYDLRRSRSLGLQCREEPEALEEAYALHLRQSRRWPGARPIPLEVTRRLLAPTGRDPGAEPPARLFTARDERGLAAAIFFLDHAHEVLAWWSGARPGARAQRAIAHVYWWAAEWAEARGRVRLNLGGSAGQPGLEAFKRSLGGRRVRFPARWLGAVHAPWPARLADSLRRRLGGSRYRGEPA